MSVYSVHIQFLVNIDLLVRYVVVEHSKGLYMIIRKIEPYFLKYLLNFAYSIMVLISPYQILKIYD